MERTAAAIAQDFHALTAGDFDENDPTADGWARLQDLCDQAHDLGDPACIPAIFDVMERLDHADLGSPGPLVHTIESWPGQYERLLAESIQRKPPPLTLWMANRILNTHPPTADTWLDLLRNVAHHPTARLTADQGRRRRLPPAPNPHVVAGASTTTSRPQAAREPPRRWMM